MVKALHFEAASHTYTLAGRRLPGVTAIIAPINELEGIPRELLEAAARFGTHVHKAVDLHNKGALDLEALDPLLAPYLAGWAECLRVTGAVVLESERRVYHRKLKYAGTLDSVVKFPGEALPAVLDVKSGDRVFRSVRPQLAGYREAYMSEGRKLSRNRYCAHLKGDGTFRLLKYSDPADWNIFLSCLNVTNWMKTP